MNRVEETLATLDQMSSKHDYDNLARFGINAKKAYGISVANLRKLAKQIGRDHDFAADLWATEWYEARMLATFIDDPARVTPSQMDRWCRDFDNWGITDTVCFHLFDKTPHAFKKVHQWHDARAEFVKRGSFALLASLALHDKKTGDETFLATLPLIEKAADDDRNFVKKGVSWALRGVGRRNAALRGPSIELSQRLIESDQPAARWIGRDALRELTKTRSAR